VQVIEETADTSIGPTLFTPRSRARPLDDAFHGRLIFPATALKRISAYRER
jgi:hypothetical protein